MKTQLKYLALTYTAREIKKPHTKQQKCAKNVTTNPIATANEELGMATLTGGRKTNSMGRKKLDTKTIDDLDAIKAPHEKAETFKSKSKNNFVRANRIKMVD